MEMWYKFITVAVRRYHALTSRASLHTVGIDRFYDDVKLCESACTTQNDEGIVKQVYSETDILVDESLRI